MPNTKPLFFSQKDTPVIYEISIREAGIALKNMQNSLKHLSLLRTYKYIIRNTRDFFLYREVYNKKQDFVGPKANIFARS